MKPRSILSSFLLILFTTLSAFSGDDSSGRDRQYLALGDSVAFGFITQAGFEYVNAANFVPYGDYVSAEFRFNEVNAACPGETTASFLSSTGVDNGCRAFPICL